MSIGLLKSSSREGGGVFLKAPSLLKSPAKSRSQIFGLKNWGLGGIRTEILASVEQKKKIGIIKIFNIVWDEKKQQICRKEKRSWNI